MRPRFTIGLDLGKQADYAAAVVVEEAPSRHLLVRAVKRYPLGTPYRFVVDDLAARLGVPPLAGAAVRLAFDATGVGSAVAEMIRAAITSAEILGVVITAGRAARRDPKDPGVWRVAKCQLVEAVRGAVRSGRLVVARSTPGAGLLTGELRDFEVRLSARGRDLYSAKTGRHDDILLALAVALWSVAAPTAESRFESTFGAHP